VALLIGLHGVHVDTEHPASAATVGQVTSGPMLQPDLPSGGQSSSTQQPKQAVQGIDKLINSLSGKFLSSIVALILSVLHAIGEAFLLRRASNAHHQFCAAFDALFVRRTTEGLLQQIHREIESQSAAFRHFNTDLSGYLKQSFQESLGPTLARLTEALERMTSTSEDRIAQLVGSLSETFRSSLTESAKTEFRQLAQSLKQTAELLEAMNTQGQSTQEELETLLIRLDESQRQQASAVEAQRRAMDELFTQMAHQVQGVASQSSASLDQMITQLIQRTTASSKDTAVELTRVLTDHAHVFEERMGTLLARLDTIVSEMGQSTQSGSERLSATTGEVVDRLEQAVTAAASAMQGATAGVVQQTGDVSAQLSEQIRQILAQQTRQVSAADAALASLEQATDRVYRIGQERDVEVYYFVATDPLKRFKTFDEHLHSLITRKRRSADNFLAPQTDTETLQSELLHDMQEDAGVVSEPVGDAPAIMTPQAVSALSPTEFEALVAAVLEAEGYDTVLTPRSNDRGIDIMGVNAAEMLFVQCKHAQDGRSFDRIAIDEVTGGETYYAYNILPPWLRGHRPRLVVAANGEADSRARRDAQQRGVHLITGRSLLKRLASARVTRTVLDRVEGQRAHTLDAVKRRLQDIAAQTPA
jgi:hypothetical protein